MGCVAIRPLLQDAFERERLGGEVSGASSVFGPGMGLARTGVSIHFQIAVGERLVFSEKTEMVLKHSHLTQRWLSRS
jgi:hypothetical protein